MKSRIAACHICTNKYTVHNTHVKQTAVDSKPSRLLHTFAHTLRLIWNLTQAMMDPPSSIVAPPKMRNPSNEPCCLTKIAPAMGPPTRDLEQRAQHTKVPGESRAYQNDVMAKRRPIREPMSSRREIRTRHGGLSAMKMPENIP
jgi:hypothetical protein